jgi:hypothetical protein
VNASGAGSPEVGDAEDWQAPDDELVRQVLIRLGDLQHRKIFYQGLENPLWVGKLAARHVFDDAPQMSVDDNGRLRSRLWPEGEYLARMAALVPEEVVPIFQQLAATDNVWVQRIILQGVTNMPSRHARDFARFLAEYMKGAERFYLEPGKFVALISSLQADGYAKQSIRLLNALYRPREGLDSEQRIGGQTVEAGLDSDAYLHWLPKSVPVLVALGEKGLANAIGWLVENERLTRYGELTADYDSSHIWRPSIASGDQNPFDNQVGHALVDAVLATASGCVQSGVEVRRVLARIDNMHEPILGRIAMEFLAILPERLLDLSEDARELMIARLLDKRSMIFGMWREYANLARVVLPRAGPEEIAAWVAFVRSNEIWPDESEIRAILAYSDNVPADVTEQEISDYRSRRRLELLAAIGRESLPSDLLGEFDRLVADYGMPARPGLPGEIEILPFVGPSSPLLRAEMADLGLDELFSYLKSWRPTATRMFGPSVEGLARQVEQLVHGDPGKFAERAWDMRELPIAYVRAAIAGWRQAIGEGAVFTTGEVWRLAAFVGDQADDGADQSASIFEEETVWRYAQQEIARLVSTYLRQRGELSLFVARLLWIILRPLTSHADPTTDRENRAIAGGMDPLTLSLNSTRPVAVRSTAYLLEAMDRHGVVADDIDLVADILDVLEEHIGPSRDPSLATAATLGEVLGIFINVAPDWLDAHAELLFGGIKSADPEEQAWSDSAFSVAVAAYGPSRTLLRYLRQWFTASFESTYIERTKFVGWKNPQSPAQHVASHVLLLYAYGVIGMDDPLIEMLFSATTPEARGDALGKLGWQFMRENISESVRIRAEELIDWRAEEIIAGRASTVELNGFHWWIKANRFPPEWWLPILELAADNPRFDPRSTLGSALAEVASRFPQQTVALLGRLVSGRAQAWERYDLVENAPLILAFALDSGDSKAQATARVVMDRLGRDGYTDLDRVVSKARDMTAE